MDSGKQGVIRPAFGDTWWVDCSGDCGLIVSPEEIALFSPQQKENIMLLLLLVPILWCMCAISHDVDSNLVLYAHISAHAHKPIPVGTAEPASMHAAILAL